jgi:hypothetical protein
MFQESCTIDACFKEICGMFFHRLTRLVSLQNQRLLNYDSTLTSPLSSGGYSVTAPATISPSSKTHTHFNDRATVSLCSSPK